MRRISILFVLCLFVGSMVAGCGTGTGTLDSTAQRFRRALNVWDHNWRQANDDWDRAWLVDHGSRMTKYHPETGR